MRIIYIRTPMAVQILNDMPDVAVHRGEPVRRNEPARMDARMDLSDWNLPAAPRVRRAGRPIFMAVTVGLHAAAALAFMSVKYAERNEAPPAAIVASIVEEPAPTEEAPPMASPPMVEISYSLPQPEPLALEVESITPPPVVIQAMAAPSHAVVPPMIESVEYVRQPAPVYPPESRRRREHGTVLLRVLVDPEGHAARIQVERSSGFERLDVAARQAVEKALFRPHEVNGVRQAAQVLIPIEFARRAS